jgi:hypothetical protein
MVVCFSVQLTQIVGRYAGLSRQDSTFREFYHSQNEVTYCARYEVL